MLRMAAGWIKCGLDERDDSHRGVAIAAGQRIHLIDAAEQFRPQPAPSAAQGGLVCCGVAGGGIG